MEQTKQSYLGFLSDMFQAYKKDYNFKKNPRLRYEEPRKKVSLLDL